MSTAGHSSQQDKDCARRVLRRHEAHSDKEPVAENEAVHVGDLPVDNTILQDMVDSETLESLLEAFGNLCGIGVGIFTPLGKRIGKPAHHSPYCHLIASTSAGEEACHRCDTNRVTAIIQHSSISVPYECHAHLIDFCEPLYRGSQEERQLIGVFFAGQLRDENTPVTNETIRSVLDTAKKYGIDDPAELVAQYIQVPRCSKSRIEAIQDWMKHFARLIGLLVEKKATTQRLLLNVIRSGDDQHAILQAVQRDLLPAAVSLFLRRPQFCAEGDDRIFLVATTYAQLAEQLEADPSSDDLSYASGEGFTGWVYSRKTPIRIADLRKEECLSEREDAPEWRHKVKEIPDVSKTKSFIAVPVRSEEGATIGVLRAVRVDGQPDFTNDDLELLFGIASVVGAAVSKAELVKTHAGRVRSLLDSLADPNTTLDSVTDRMAESLGETYVDHGPWEAVHIVRHYGTLKEFCMLGVYPPDHRAGAIQEKGHTYRDDTGVASHMLKTRKSFAHHDFPKSDVSPALDWKCVAAAPIVHRNKFWGAVTLCGNNVQPSDVYDTLSEVEHFAQQMSNICLLSETLDTNTGASEAISKLVSLSGVLHETKNDLETAQVTIDRLREQLGGDAEETASDLAELIRASVRWMSVCQALGRFIASCRREPDTAVRDFWQDRLDISGRAARVDQSHQIDVKTLVQNVRASVSELETKYETKVEVSLEADTVVEGDENLVYHAVRNLLENAFVWGSRPGEGAGIRKGVPIICRVTASEDGRETCILVRDQGAGMDPPTLAATMEVYKYPTRLGSLALGLGIGTMITAFVAAVHEGRVSVKSEPECGTTVRFSLPSTRKERRD